MSYQRAEKILPPELVAMIQQYVDGDYLYIPRRESERKAWGEKTGGRAELAKRNQEIYSGYQNGRSVSRLAAEYFLSEKSIQRIILQQRCGKCI